MDTSTSVLLTGVIVAWGQWSEGQTSPSGKARIIFGALFLAIILTVLSDTNEKLAKQFGILILVAATMRYSLSIVGKSNITKPVKK